MTPERLTDLARRAAARARRTNDADARQDAAVAILEKEAAGLSDEELVVVGAMAVQTGRREANAALGGSSVLLGVYDTVANRAALWSYEPDPETEERDDRVRAALDALEAFDADAHRAILARYGLLGTEAMTGEAIARSFGWSLDKTHRKLRAARAVLTETLS